MLVIIISEILFMVDEILCLKQKQSKTKQSKKKRDRIYIHNKMDYQKMIFILVEKRI